MKKLKNIPLLFLFGFGISIMACNQTPKDLTKSNTQAKAQYKFGFLMEKSLSSSVRLPGKLVPFDEVNLFPKLNGFVKKLYVDRGSFVKKGQIVLELEAPEMLAQFESARSKYLQAQENANASREKYTRLKEASSEPGAVSSFDLDNAYSKMKADQAMENSEKSNVSSIKAMEEYLIIRAPFSGYITSRNISLGAYVSPGKAMDQPMLELQNNQKLRLTVYIPENYVEKLNLKGPVRISYNSLPGEIFTGQISRMAHSLSHMQSEAIEIDVSNTKGILSSGMYAEVEIPLLTQAQTILVPNSAIVRSTESKYIIKKVKGKALWIPIQEGLVTKDSSEVFGDLKPGDPIVLNANDEIKQGEIL